jgi:hypothetical protein
MASWCRFGQRAATPGGRCAGTRSKWVCSPVEVSIARGQARSSPGCNRADWSQSWGTVRRSSCACGTKRSARASCTLPRSSGAAMVVGGCGACCRSASLAMPRVSWIFTTRRTSGGRGPPPGWMGAPCRRAGGLPGPGTAYGTAGRTGCWLTWRRPWTSRGCLSQHGRPYVPCRPLCNGIASTSTMSSTWIIRGEKA